jgi:glucosylceramidase
VSSLCLTRRQIKILAFDHNKDHLLSWARTMLFPSADTSKLSEFVDGMAFHWYSGNDRLLDGTYGYEAVNATYHLAPEKILMATEGCNCPGPLSLPLSPHLGRCGD